MDPYEILGLRPGASDAEIVAAYRQLAHATHPAARDDVSERERDRALSRMTLLNVAFERLIRPEPLDDETTHRSYAWSRFTKAVRRGWDRLSGPSTDGMHVLALLDQLAALPWADDDGMPGDGSAT